MKNDILFRLLNWFEIQSKINPIWMENNPLVLQVLENPGFLLTIKKPHENCIKNPILSEEQGVDLRSFPISRDWYSCKLVKDKFIGAGDFLKLEKIVGIFLDALDYRQMATCNSSSLQYMENLDHSILCELGKWFHFEYQKNLFWQENFNIGNNTLLEYDKTLGWRVEISLLHTKFQEIEFKPLKIGNNQESKNCDISWLNCFVKDNAFYGFSSIDKVVTVFQIFLDFVNPDEL